MFFYLKKNKDFYYYSTSDETGKTTVLQSRRLLRSKTFLYVLQMYNVVHQQQGGYHKSRLNKKESPSLVPYNCVRIKWTSRNHAIYVILFHSTFLSFLSLYLSMNSL